MATPEQTKTMVENADPAQSLINVINKSFKELGKAVPAHLRPDAITRAALTCARVNPKLMQCTQASFLGALFTAAHVGLEPGVGGRCYILPFWNSRKRLNPKPGETEWHKVLEAQFILGYKGLADLFYRHEKAVQLDWAVVRQGDEFEYELGTGAFLKHKPKLGNESAPIAYWTLATLANGGKTFKVMSHAEAMQHGREHSKTFDKKTNAFYADSPWATEPEAMCLKTCLIQLAKLLPMSLELQRAIGADESSHDFKRALVEGLDAQSETEWSPSAEPKELPPGNGGKPSEPEIPFGEK